MKKNFLLILCLLLVGNISASNTDIVFKAVQDKIRPVKKWIKRNKKNIKKSIEAATAIAIVVALTRYRLNSDRKEKELRLIERALRTGHAVPLQIRKVDGQQLIFTIPDQANILRDWVLKNVSPARLAQKHGISEGDMRRLLQNLSPSYGAGVAAMRNDNFQ